MKLLSDAQDVEKVSERQEGTLHVIASLLRLSCATGR